MFAPLPDGPLDVVGDVHGELDALLALLAHLGYDADGGHPEGRHLVAGDLAEHRERADGGVGHIGAPAGHLVGLTVPRRDVEGDHRL